MKSLMNIFQTGIFTLAALGTMVSQASAAHVPSTTNQSSARTMSSSAMGHVSKDVGTTNKQATSKASQTSAVQKATNSGIIIVGGKGQKTMSKLPWGDKGSSEPIPGLGNMDPNVSDHAAEQLRRIKRETTLTNHAAQSDNKFDAFSQFKANPINKVQANQAGVDSNAANAGIIIVRGKNSLSSSNLKPGDAVSLNPQPLPPKIAGKAILNSGDTVSLNPQPLPPKTGSALRTVTNSGNIFDGGETLHAWPTNHHGSGTDSKLNAESLKTAVQFPAFLNQTSEQKNTAHTPVDQTNKNKSPNKSNTPSETGPAPKASSLSNITAGQLSTSVVGTVDTGSSGWQSASGNGHKNNASALLNPPTLQQMKNTGTAASNLTAKQLKTSVIGKDGVLTGYHVARLQPSRPTSDDPNAFTMSTWEQISAYKSFPDGHLHGQESFYYDEGYVPTATRGDGSKVYDYGLVPRNNLGTAFSTANNGKFQTNPIPIPSATPTPNDPSPSGRTGEPAHTLPTNHNPSGRVILPNGSPLGNMGGSTGGSVESNPTTDSATADAAVQPAATVATTDALPPAGADLVLENIELASSATLIAGPAYTVKFRNQGTADAAKFQVAVLVGVDGKLADDASHAVVEVKSLTAGKSAEVTLRLPQSALKLIGTDNQPTAFTQLFVAVDLMNTVAETDESNNTAVVERSALEASTTVAN